MRSEYMVQKYNVVTFGSIRSVNQVNNIVKMIEIRFGSKFFSMNFNFFLYNGKIHYQEKLQNKGPK